MDQELNIEEIRSSGLLELYVAGSLPENEQQAVHEWVQKNPELLEEVQQIEADLMAYAEGFVMEEPSDEILAEALKRIETEEGGSATKVVDMPSEMQKNQVSTSVRQFNWWQIAAAAALLISLAVNVILYLKNQQLDKKYEEIVASNQQFAQENESLRTRMGEQEGILDHLADGNSQLIRLDNLQGEQNEVVWLTWNEKTGAVYLQQNLLGSLSEDLVYQLWAIVDGKPVDAGLLESNRSVDYYALDQINGRPTTFAVTIEPAGGSENPTLDQMVVAGNVTVEG